MDKECLRETEDRQTDRQTVGQKDRDRKIEQNEV